MRFLVLLLLLAAHAVRRVKRDTHAQIPDAEERADDLFQCDRQCRWKHGFFDRNIIGERGLKDGWDTNWCRCYRLTDENTAVLIADEIIPAQSETEFDKENTWSGDFSCPYVCANTPGGLTTLTREDALASAEVSEIIHCGSCSTCSAPEDVVVLAQSRAWITEVMGSIAGDFSAPWGHKDVTRLENDLTAAGMNFSMTRADGRTDRPTCMQCWSDNIMCTRKSCSDVCWIKFFDPSNPPSDIENCDPLDFHCKCLKCDEEYCGPAFIKCAGANRRSTGIISDISRPGPQQCPIGKYSGVPEEDLPTLPKPDGF